MNYATLILISFFNEKGCVFKEEFHFAITQGRHLGSIDYAIVTIVDRIKTHKPMTSWSIVRE